MLVNGQGFTSDTRLIGRDGRWALVDARVASLIVLVLLASCLPAASVIYGVENAASGGTILIFIVSQHFAVSRNCLTILQQTHQNSREGKARSKAHLDDNDITGHDISCLDFMLATISDNGSAECNARLELFDDITGGLLLVPTDESVL